MIFVFCQGAITQLMLSWAATNTHCDWPRRSLFFNLAEAFGHVSGGRALGQSSASCGTTRGTVGSFEGL